MNRYYSYPNIELWQTELWADRVASVSHLIEYIQETNEIKPSDYVPSYEITEDLRKHPLYREKTHGIDDPAVLKKLDEMGLNYLATGQGGTADKECCWFCICPKEAIENWTKLPVYLAFEREDESDPRWTMRAVMRYWKNIEDLRKNRDYIIVVLVNQFPTYDKIYFNIMQEFSVLFPCDINRMYLDVSRVVSKGRLADVPGFVYTDAQGKLADPDQAVERFTALQIPVLNLVGRWGNGDSLERALVMTHRMNDGKFDREWLVHSGVGRRMAQDMLYEYRYQTVEDPAFQKEMEDKGLFYKVCYNRYQDRYIWAIPRQAMEEGKKLPVVLLIQEVYGGNEHLAVTAHSYCAEWLEIAAQGECALMIFALEDIVSNDRAIEMIKADAEKYPLDLERVYVTGHSHDGYFSYAMANRNPDFFAAMGVHGMNTCPFGMNEKPDYTQKHNIFNYDIPEVNITGLWESRFPVDEADKRTRYVDLWKHVFMNHHIPNKTTEDILAAFESDDYTEHTTCIAGDRFRTLWLDGIEYYIVDFDNEQGRNHLRVIRMQNMPHTFTPMMCTLTWDFVRRFKRDAKTHEIIELF